ncbi:MAG: transposase [Planctomycetes bacterium]|nr:transposase [Planctomycetota bacterium]
MTLLDQGRSQSEVARHLGVTASAVSQWVKARNQGGEEALRARPHPGPTPKLNDRQLQRLEKVLLRGPRAHGYPTELWTLNRVTEVIEKRLGVTYDPSGVWHVLHRMGWSCQKPESRWNRDERDEEAIVRWRKTDWPRIKKRATKR